MHPTRSKAETNNEGRCFYLSSSIAVRSDQGECTAIQSDLHPLQIQAIANYDGQIEGHELNVGNH